MIERLQFTAWTLAVLAAFVACLSSFNWGMYRFFTEPGGGNSGIWSIKLLGTGMGLASLAGIPLFGARSASSASTALLIYALSLALFWWAIDTNRTRPLSFAFSDDAPRHLVSSGPYRWVRHPFYSAYLLAWAGSAVATLQPLMLVPLAPMTAIYIAAAKIEERKFETSVLATAYACYRTRTGMFLPHRLPARQQDRP